MDGYRNAPVLLVQVAGGGIRDGLAVFAIACGSTCGHMQDTFGNLWVESQLAGQPGFASFTFQQQVFRG